MQAQKDYFYSAFLTFMFYVEDIICEMEHDSNLKFNTCKHKKRNKGQNKYNLVNHKKIKVKNICVSAFCLHIL